MPTKKISTPEPGDPETVASVMADRVRKKAPEGWTVEHLDADSCPSQGWGKAPVGYWYFRNRHGRWTFAVGNPNGDERYVPIDGAAWSATGEGDMLLSDEIVKIVLDCMRGWCLAYSFSTKPRDIQPECAP